MVTKERMDIFIDEHIHPDEIDEIKDKVFNLIDENNVEFMDEMDSLLTIEDVVENADVILSEIVNKY